MRSVQYGTKLIEYSTLERQGLTSHYISVDNRQGVVLKGVAVTAAKADQLILKKAKWILQKLEVVKAMEEGDINTGSRLPYFGKTYYVEVISKTTTKKVLVQFNYSGFKIHANPTTSQEEFQEAIEAFYKAKAIEKIKPRVVKIAATAKLPYTSLSFRKMAQRWGSCTGDNKIILNTDAVKLPWSLIDYLIIHELCHTKIKDHSKGFWALLSRHEPKWRELNERVQGMRG